MCYCKFSHINSNRSHWVAYYKKHKFRIYFDSYGQVILDEIKKYLKTNKEQDKLVIRRNTDIVQPNGTKICGHLCLYVLKSISNGNTFRDVLNTINIKKGTGISWENKLSKELHKPVRHNFPKRYVFVRHVDDVWAEISR